MSNKSIDKETHISINIFEQRGPRASGANGLWGPGFQVPRSRFPGLGGPWAPRAGTLGPGWGPLGPLGRSLGLE